MKRIRSAIVLTLIFGLANALGFAQAKMIQPGDIFAQTFGNEIWRLSANDTTGGTGEFFVRPPEGGSLWGVGADANRNLYFIYEQAPNHVIARVTASGAVQTLATLPLPGSQFFVADYAVAASGNNYIFFRSTTSANAWLARVGTDGKAIDVQNGQQISGPFTTAPVNAGSSGKLAINSQERVLVLAKKVGDDLLYDVRAGTPLLALGVLDVADIEYANDQLWALRPAGGVARHELLQVTLPASPQTGPLAVLSKGVFDTFPVAKEGTLLLFGMEQVLRVDLETFGVSTRPFRESKTGITPQKFAAVLGGPVPPPDVARTGSDLYGFGQTPTGADPVATSTGEYFQSDTDLALRGPRPLNFMRYFGGLLGSTAEAAGFYAAADSPMGANWIHNFFILLKRSSANSVAIYFQQGKVLQFQKSAGIWSLNQPGNAYRGTPYQLVEAGTKLKMLDPASNSIYTFETAGLADGMVRGVESIADRNGNTHTLAYNPDNTIRSVSDGLGRRLDFTYETSEGKPRIVKVADQTGRAIQYGYIGSQLNRVTDARGKVLSYVSNAASQIESITQPAGNTLLRNTYSDAKVVSQLDGLGNTSRFNYAVGQTVITDPLGNNATHVFDGQLRLIRHTDRAGKSIDYSYDSLQRKTSTTDRMGDRSTTSYDDASGKIAALVDSTGQTWRYNYTSQTQDGFTFRNLTRIDYPGGTREELSYDVRGNLSGRRDRAGKNWAYSYNDRGQLLTETNPDGGVGRYTYNSDATLASLQDPAGNTTTLAYDEIKRLNRVTYADGTTVQYSYDASDHLVTRVNEKGKTTTLSYDDNDNLKSMVDALGRSWAFSYDANDRLITMTDPLGRTERRTYDALQRVKTVSDRKGNTVTYSYDARGRLTGVTDPAGKTWTLTYDDEGIPTSMTNPLGARWTFTSDKQGRIKTATDPLSAQSRYDYDAFSRLVSQTNPLNETIAYTYDERGLLAQVSEPESVSASYTRSNLGQVTQIRDGRGKAWSRGYDNFGRLVSITDPLGQTTGFIYDSRNRLSRVNLPAALGAANVSYDPTGRLSEVSYSDGVRIAFSYDDVNRLVGSSGVALTRDENGRLVSSNGVTAVRDAAGRITAMTLEAGKTVQYAYDSRDLLASVTDWTGAITRFVYDDARRLTTVTRPNGIVTRYSYDSADRLISIIESQGTASLSTLTLARDAAGRIKQAVRNAPQQDVLPGPRPQRQFNDADQISAFQYDALGRLTSDGQRQFQWDLASRLVSLQDGSASVTFEYDGLGNRIRHSQAGATRSFVWNYLLALPSVSIIRDGEQTTRYYIHTPAGSLLYSVEAAGGARRFYHYDEMGSTLFLTDDTGNITDKYSYSAYGRLTASTGSSDNPFTFIGRYGVMRESSTDLYYMRARYYDSSAGRLISRDPLAFDPYDPKSLNLYQYASENPLAFIDPEGTDFRYGDIYHLEIDPNYQPADLSLGAPLGPLPDFSSFRPSEWGGGPTSQNPVIPRGLTREQPVDVPSPAASGCQAAPCDPRLRTVFPERCQHRSATRPCHRQRRIAENTQDH